MLRILDNKEKEELQRKGYMIEHLLCLYSMGDTTALYNENFPVYLNDFGEVDAILFGFKKKYEDIFECIKELAKLRINVLNILAPNHIREIPNLEQKEVDWDFHININKFDFDLKGGKYKDIRYRLRHVEKMNYNLKLSREFTPKHTYIISRHMAAHEMDVWDYQELLFLERFFREHSHGLIMEAYKDTQLIGFDIVDFFEDNRIMAVPLGIYLNAPLLSYFTMYENLKYAREKGYEWLDIGSACGVVGLRRFKEKWLAKPKYKIYTQTMKTIPKKR